MPIIPFQPQPKIPPIGFFDPISVDPKDMMTDVEYLLGILKKLNSMIAQINANTKFIEEYSGKIEELEAEIADLRQEMTDFEEHITEDIQARFIRIKAELDAMVATALIQANAYTDAVATVLNQRIQEIAIGQITIYDPTTGLLSPLQTVIDNLFGVTRDALTADEYDSLELTATAYDALQISAFDYDMYGKTLLYPVVSA